MKKQINGNNVIILKKEKDFRHLVYNKPFGTILLCLLCYNELHPELRNKS